MILAHLLVAQDVRTAIQFNANDSVKNDETTERYPPLHIKFLKVKPFHEGGGSSERSRIEIGSKTISRHEIPESFFNTYLLTTQQRNIFDSFIDTLHDFSKYYCCAVVFH